MGPQNEKVRETFRTVGLWWNSVIFKNTMYKPLSQTLSEGEESDVDSLSISSSKAFYSPAKHGRMPARGSGSELEGQHHTMELNGMGSNCHHGTGASSPLPPLSLARKIAFALSIFNCLALIVIFVWILPCDYDTCQAPVNRHQSELKWEIQMPGLDVKDMDVAEVINGDPKILVAAFQSNSSWNNSSCTDDVPLCRGFVGLSLDHGVELWRNHFSIESDWIDCRSIDVNGDRVKDCLVGSKQRALVAIDPTTGSLLWQIHSHSVEKWDPLQVTLGPVRLMSPDVHGDGVRDLVTMATANDSQWIFVISGRSGELRWRASLGQSECQQMISVDVETETNTEFFRYHCLLQNNSVYSGRVKCSGCPSLPSRKRNEVNRAVPLIRNDGVCPNCWSQLTLYDVGQVSGQQRFPKSLIRPPVVSDSRQIAFHLFRWLNTSNNDRVEVEESIRMVSYSSGERLDLSRAKNLVTKKHSCNAAKENCTGEFFTPVKFTAYRSGASDVVVTAEKLDRPQPWEHGTLTKKLVF